MYEKIYVPVDNSGHSNRAIDQALTVGQGYGSTLVGCHVYAARMHDYRFKQMEYTLPEEYLVETELSRQRKIHDSLITMGLELISDCYLQRIDEMATEAGLVCERRMMDGKHSTEILKDLAEAEDVDLVVLGAVGIGRTKDSQIGSVAARVARETTKDTWIVKHVPDTPRTNGNGNGNGHHEEAAERDTILVGVDGSPESFGALEVGVELAKRFGKKLEVVSVYDPYLHYAAFRGIAEVLTDKAAKVFRFEEQNQLHEEIIDTGLAEIYQSHLNVAGTMAAEKGVEPAKTLLDGKAYQKVLDHARKVEPWVLILGRVGVHAEEADGGLGSNTENLLRLAPCDVLLTNRRVVPELDLKASESIHWTPEAEERMTRVPEQVLGIARTAILRLAIEQGHSVVSSDLVTQAMDRFMPKSTAKATEQLAEALAFEKARREQVSLCKGCGIAARAPDPVRCTVCGGTDFEVVAPEVIDRIAAGEGGTTEERTYDGRKLAWTQDARKALRAIPDRYQRRRAKARIEKSAHGQKLPTITFEMAAKFIEEETGVLYEAAPDVDLSADDEMDDAPVSTGPDNDPNGHSDDADLNLIARDTNRHPLRSRYEWTDEAAARVLRVPAGFMRDRTQGRVEELAAARRVASIDLPLVEDGIAQGIQMMADMIGSMESQAEAEKVEARPEPVEAAEKPEAGGCPFAKLASEKPEEARAALNEISVMSEMERKRREIGTSS
jgi:nucleotide-binding universal stress UspA family protein